MGSTLETYIKQCEKATKIQESWQPAAGDRFTPKADLYYTDWSGPLRLWMEGDDDEEGRGRALIKGIVYVSGDLVEWDFVGYCDRHCALEDFSLVVWLPYQHQLQKLVRDAVVSDGKLATRFGQWYADYGDYRMSMEQLWLAFVMHQKCGKVWDGADWQPLPVGGLES